MSYIASSIKKLGIKLSAVLKACLPLSISRSNSAVADELLKWKSLHEKGVITDEQFEAKRASLLD